MNANNSAQHGVGAGAGPGARGGSTDPAPGAGIVAGGKPWARCQPAADTPPRSKPKAKSAAPAGARVRGDLVHVLGVVRVATAEQCRTLATPNANSTAYVRRALRALAGDGLAASVPLGTAHERVWFLTGSGQRAAQAAGLAPAKRRAVTAAMARSGMLRHALAVTATISAFTAHRHGTVGSWSVETPHRSGSTALVTDAVLQVLPGPGVDAPPVVLVELDRGTRPLGRLAEQIAAYAELAADREHRLARGRSRWTRSYPGPRRFPPVLIVSAGLAPTALASRVDRLAAASLGWQRYGEDLVDVGVLDLAQLTEHGPRAPIVTPLRDPGARIALAQLPDAY